MSRYLKFWEWSDFIHNLTAGTKIKSQLKLIEDLIQSIIQEKKKQYLSGNKDNVKGKRKAFMDLLLELHFENQELSEKDILDEVNTFIAAGYETVSVTITWALYLIGPTQNSREDSRGVRQNIRIGRDRDVTEGDLNELKYLDCVLKGTFIVKKVPKMTGFSASNATQMAPRRFQ
ncbi:cytochrome P450 4V2 [Trichonephila inaurata madagascariensis]|uniref:Cytochrome P450 4V2 n=1 Tax=Trichonephila inaurata madagascariensis TaxID=2747483 RepID=A0A8X6MC36_9ARAC|nr:cytochrome P450 4V2 [Trichonephila inaurata madagascariensis]